MKLSLRLQDQHQNHHQNNHPNPLLLRAKVPISIFGLPFLSGFTTTDHHPSDLSLSLRSNFPSGPSLKLSYTPTPSTTTAAPPLTLTLKSGLSLSGSPLNSPLIISAHFSFSPQNPNPNPTFSLQVKPQFGDFSFRKTIFSNPNPKANGSINSIGFVPIERPVIWNDLKMVSDNKASILSGILVMANTTLPVTKRMAVNFRWGVNFPNDLGKEFPVLSVNKIGIERVDEVKEVKEKRSESKVGDTEVLKGMYSSMRKELDGLQRENKEVKHMLEEMKIGSSARNGYGVGKKAVPIVENSGGFEQWRSKKSGGEENGRKDSKKNVDRSSDVESELQRAIKAASS